MINKGESFEKYLARQAPEGKLIESRTIKFIFFVNCTLLC